MAKKRKTAASRLSALQKIVSDAGGTTPYPYLGPKIDWDNPTAWSSEARRAFDPTDLAPSLRIAFEKFKLDPRDPHNWWMLLGFFADAHFGRSIGRPKKWNGESLCDLLRKISDVRKNSPKAKPSDVFRILVKKGARYSEMKADALKHAYSAALNRRRNVTLFRIVDENKTSYRKILEFTSAENGLPLRASVERQIEKLALADALRAIGAPNCIWENK